MYARLQYQLTSRRLCDESSKFPVFTVRRRLVRVIHAASSALRRNREDRSSTFALPRNGHSDVPSETRVQSLAAGQASMTLGAFARGGLPSVRLQHCTHGNQRKRPFAWRPEARDAQEAVVSPLGRLKNHHWLAASRVRDAAAAQHSRCGNSREPILGSFCTTRSRYDRDGRLRSRKLQVQLLC